MMTLDEAIDHVKELARQNNKWADDHENGDEWDKDEAHLCRELAKEYSQYVDWLTELKNYRKQKEWISVHDKLPSKGQQVLVSCNTGYRTSDYFNGSWFESFTDSEEEVIDWMPFPEHTFQNIIGGISKK